ncbi:MAG: DUF5606 domain-containing protein [Bacteroidales bacterium]|nr:DUF5606 domain-containing protein [Bacteroidales bacterium]MCF8404661.1 DUF5606 domain-containing protein [Bacteroidales bacterium]
MDLTKILAISGKPGLYKMITQTKNGLIVESIPEGKKFTAFSHERISTLEEISIYTDDEDKPLKEVLKAIYDKQEGKAAISPKASGNELKAFFGEAVPDYDKENVYVSDIKKILLWYNTLQENNILNFEEEKEEEKPEEKGEAKDENQKDKETDQ